MKTRTKLLAAAAGTAMGYYFYGSPDAKKNRKIAATWAIDLKKDVVKRAKKLRTIDRKAMHGVVSSVAKVYQGVRGLDKKQVRRAAAELKDNWDIIATELKGKKKLAK